MFHRHREHHEQNEGAISLTRLPAGGRGRVVSVAGGHRMAERLLAMGIRPGQTITKLSAMFLRGPVTVKAGRTQLALGHGMARKIMVIPDDGRKEDTAGR